jgi:hypothetical protein
MNAGDRLTSPDGRYTAFLQYDGGFLLFWGALPGRLYGTMWASDYAGAPAPIAGGGTTYTADMQTDGNFVVYQTDGGQNRTPVWPTNTLRGQGSYYAAMQADGNFVLYEGTPGNPGGAYWATGTNLGTVWAHNSGAYVADVVSPENETGGIDAGQCKSVSWASWAPNLTLQLIAVGSPIPIAKIQLGALRAQRYQFTGSALSPSYQPVAGQGDF